MAAQRGRHISAGQLQKGGNGVVVGVEIFCQRARLHGTGISHTETSMSAWGIFTEQKTTSHKKNPLVLKPAPAAVFFQNAPWKHPCLLGKILSSPQNANARKQRQKQYPLHRRNSQPGKSRHQNKWGACVQMRTTYGKFRGKKRPQSILPGAATTSTSRRFPEQTF